jgi:hypothetical protein
MEPEMALPSGSTDNGASHIQVRHTGATVAQVVGLIVVSLSVGVALLVDPRGRQVIAPLLSCYHMLLHRS